MVFINSPGMKFCNFFAKAFLERDLICAIIAAYLVGCSIFRYTLAALHQFSMLDWRSFARHHDETLQAEPVDNTVYVSFSRSYPGQRESPHDIQSHHYPVRMLDVVCMDA